MSDIRWNHRAITDRVAPTGFDTWAEAADQYWWNNRSDMIALVGDVNARGRLEIPIVVEDGSDGLVMVDGHRRVLAAVALMTDVPLTIRTGDER